jgi:hypothetical protein
MLLSTKKFGQDRPEGPYNTVVYAWLNEKIDACSALKLLVRLWVFYGQKVERFSTPHTGWYQAKFGVRSTCRTKCANH